MNRKEALAANGVYVGTLEEVTADRPWRAMEQLSALNRRILRQSIGRAAHAGIVILALGGSMSK